MKPNQKSIYDIDPNMGESPVAKVVREANALPNEKRLKALSKLAEAPFVKVEATRFTEVGYVGRDVEQIVRDLLEIAIAMEKVKKRIRERKTLSDELLLNYQ